MAARNPGDPQGGIRYDMILVTPGKIPQHTPYALDATR